MAGVQLGAILSQGSPSRISLLMLKTSRSPLHAGAARAPVTLAQGLGRSRSRINKQKVREFAVQWKQLLGVACSQHAQQHAQHQGIWQRPVVSGGRIRDSGSLTETDVHTRITHGQANKHKNGCQSAAMKRGEAAAEKV